MEETYANVFSSCKFKHIKSIEVGEMDQMPAIEIVVRLYDDTLSRASLPRWCCESEDKGFILYYVNKVLAPMLTGHDPLTQNAIDKILDLVIKDASLNTKLDKLAKCVNWAVSVAVCKAGARCKDMALYKYIAKLAKYDSNFSLPTPSFNITNGGFKCPKNRLVDQHLVILPLNANSFHDAFRLVNQIYDEYFKVPSLEEIDGLNAIDEEGDEGVYTICLKDLRNCVRSLKKIIADFGDKDKEKVSTGLNIGASKFYTGNKTYRFNISEEENCGALPEISSDALYEAYRSFVLDFTHVTLEDPFHLDDREYSSKLAEKFFPHHLVMEFDSVTDNGTLRKMIWEQVSTGSVLKVDQIGSVTKCIQFVLWTKKQEWTIDMSSHDSCKTSDPFIADFCVGLCLEKLKIGVSCITSACNICNRAREIDIETAKYLCRKYPIPGRDDYGNMKAYFKLWGLPLDAL